MCGIVWRLCPWLQKCCWFWSPCDFHTLLTLGLDCAVASFYTYTKVQGIWRKTKSLSGKKKRGKKNLKRPDALGDEGNRKSVTFCDPNTTSRTQVTQVTLSKNRSGLAFEVLVFALLWVVPIVPRRNARTFSSFQRRWWRAQVYQFTTAACWQDQRSTLEN